MAIVLTMIIAISTKACANETQTTSEKRMPSAKLTPSDNVINLNEKNTVEFTFSTNPPTPGIPVYIQISPNFVDWLTLKQGLTGSDGTFKASYRFERPGSIDCRALWIWENHTFIAGYPLQIVAYYSSPCIIATVAYGSPMAPEVAYMRHVRDDLIGSTEVGKEIVKAWNAFYYSWPPTVANFAARSDVLKALLRALLTPLVGITWIAGYTFESIAQINQSLASVVAFAVAAILSITVYILTPMLCIIQAYRLISKHAGNNSASSQRLK
jgi:hypothetical protein